MGSQRLFPPAQEVEIARRYRVGESAPRLARDYGVDASTVCDALRRHGVKLRGNVLRFTEEQIAELARRYRGGATLRELAAELGVDKASIGRRLKEHGVTIRSAAEASRRLECDYGFFDSLRSHESHTSFTNTFAGVTLSALADPPAEAVEGVLSALSTAQGA